MSGPPTARDPSGARRSGGVPDGLIVGGLAFLLGVTVLTWTAAGLSGFLSHGRWPPGVTFTRTPPAIRALVSDPRDLAAAYPGTDPDSLSGYGLFWGVFISQAMVLCVLGAFVAVALSRRRALRAGGSPKAVAPPERDDAASDVDVPGVSEPVARSNPPEPPAAPHPRPSPEQTDHHGVRFQRSASTGAAEEGRMSAVRALLTAPGPALVVTGDASLYTATVDVRRTRGPVLVYDPTRHADVDRRVRWAPHQGCVEMDAARHRAEALLRPVQQPAAPLDPAAHDTAVTLLRCWLHAAALADSPFRQVHRWASGPSSGHSSAEAVRTLRSHPHASPGAAEELESALSAHLERREKAQELVRRALITLQHVHIRNACSPTTGEAHTLETWLTAGGTLYILGETLEAPYRDGPSAMPLVTALASSVVEYGRRVAARSPDGRLDPPLTVVLDQPATVAPVPQLPWLLAHGASSGMPTLALLRSTEQALTWWPDSRLESRRDGAQGHAPPR